MWADKDILDNLTDYERYLRYQRQLSPGTISMYLRCVTKLKGTFNKTLVSTNRSDIQNFFSILEKENLRRNSVANYIMAFRSYFTWLADLTHKEEIIHLSFYLLKVIKAKKEHNIVVVPTIEEIAKLRESCKAYKKAASFNPQSKFYKRILQQTAALELLITAGLRSNELRSLRYSDVNLNERTILIKKGKGNKQRVSLFGESAYESLREYFDNNSFVIDTLLFPYKWGSHLNVIIKRWTKRANINPLLHAHSFRHFFITESDRQGASLEIIADQVGHDDLNTTRGYRHSNTQLLKERFSAINI